MRESEIEDYLCRRVRAMGGDVRKVRFLDVNGAPDRLVMLPADTAPPRLPLDMATTARVPVSAPALTPEMIVWPEA